jgi:hypothetical protein
MDIFIGLSSNLETINTSDKTKSSSDSDSGFILSSFVAVTEGSSIENKNESNKDIKTKINNMFLNN